MSILLCKLAADAEDLTEDLPDTAVRVRAAAVENVVKQIAHLVVPPDKIFVSRGQLHCTIFASPMQM